MAFRGIKPAIKAYVIFQATVNAVEQVVDVETGEARYYKVTTSAGVVNLGMGGVEALQQRYDFDELSDIVGQQLDFKYVPNKDTSYGEFQLAFVLGRMVEGVAETPAAPKQKKGW